MPASHIIINHTHLHSLLRFLHQHIAHHTAYGVILEDIKLHVDMSGRLLQFAQQGLNHGKSPRIDFHTVSIERKSLVGVAKQRDKAAVICRKRTGILGKIFGHRLLQQTVVTLLANDTHPPLAAAEEEVKHQSHHRKEHQHQYPRHCLYRITVIENDNRDCSDNCAKIDNIECYCGNQAGYEVPIKHTFVTRRNKSRIKIKTDFKTNI